MHKQKVVIIGGSSGVGLAIAKGLYEKGFDVLIAGRSKEKLDKAKKSIGEIQTQILDVTEEKEIASFFSSSLDELDHLVTPAADFIVGHILEQETSQARRFFESKFWGQYCAAKYAAPKMRPGGSITLFCGTAAHKPMPNFSAGCAINGAIEGLTRSLALDLAPLRVNAIAPGAIATPAWESIPEKKREQQFKEIAQKLPVGRIGQPEDIVHAVLFLIQCGYATGTVVTVDGGDRVV